MADGDNIEQKIKLTYETNADKTAKSVDKLDDSIQNTTESQKEGTKQTKKQKQSLDSLGGGIGGTIKGMKGMLKSMWAIVMNPLGLVIAAIALALTGLFKAFTSTKAGGEKFDQVMDGISATIDVLRDRVLKIAGAIAKFFSGDFAGAIADGKAAVSGFGEEVAREFRIAADATKSLQEVADSMRELGVSRAKLNRDLKEAKEIIESETASYDEKTEAIKRVSIAESEQTEKELANAQKKLDAIRAQNAQSDSSSEALQAEADAEIALFNIQEKSADNKTKNILLLRKADNEEKARLKELSTARIEEAKVAAKLKSDEAAEVQKLADLKIREEERLAKAIEDLEDKTEEAKLTRRRQREIERLEDLKKQGVDIRELLISNDELFNELEDELLIKRTEEKEERDAVAREKQLAADKEFADEQNAIEVARLDQKKVIEDSKFKIASQAIGLAKSLFGKSKAVQKGAIIAENAIGIGKTIINVVSGNAAALAQGIVQAGPIAGPAIAAPAIALNTISGAISVASSIAATAKALQAVGGGSAGGGASIPKVGGGGASAAPQVDFQASSENQIATTIADNANEQPPIEAFVVESQVTTTQALARQREDDNSFG